MVEMSKNFARTKRGVDSIPLKVNFKHGENKLTIEKWTGPDKGDEEEE
jgi:hypothetical protein